MDIMDKGKSLLGRNGTKSFLQNNVIYIILIGYFVIFSFVTPRFFTISNLSNVLRSGSVTMLLAVGMVFTLIAGHIDISMGMNMFMSATFACFCGRMGAPMPVMVLGAIAVGMLGGLLNGLLVGFLDTYAMLPTMATQFLFRSIGLTILGKRTGIMPADWSSISTVKLGPFPLFVYIAVSLALLAQVFLNETKTGRRIFALGDNQKTAIEKGIHVFRIKITVFVISGFMAALAGLVLSSQAMEASTSIGITSHTYAILAAVLGGASLHGAKGTAFPGAFVGAMLIALMSNALGLTGASPYLYQIVYAIVILVVYVLDTAKHKENL